MSDEGEKTCPLCAEEMDLTDQQLKPCKCGYEICVWCWHHIMDMAEKDNTEGRCPACRTPYNKEKIVGTASKCERLAAGMGLEKKQKSQKGKSKTSDGRKQLGSVRVIQRNLVYIVGLPLNLADEDLLQQKEYFGQYGKVLKVSISRTAAGAIQQFPNSTCSVYITYSKEEEAVRSIQSAHGFVLEGRPLRACFGTTKYCHAWLRNVPCTNADCLYLHEFGLQEDSFTKDEIISAYTRNRVQQTTGATNDMQRRAGNLLPPPADDYSNNSNPAWAKPNSKSINNNSANSMKVSPPNSSSGRQVALPAAASWGARVSNGQPVVSDAVSLRKPSKLQADTCSTTLSFSSAVASPLCHRDESHTFQEKSNTGHPVTIKKILGTDHRRTLSETPVNTGIPSSSTSSNHLFSASPKEDKQIDSNSLEISGHYSNPVLDKDQSVADEGRVHNSVGIDQNRRPQSCEAEQFVEPLSSTEAENTAKLALDISVTREQWDLVSDLQKKVEEVAISETEEDTMSFNDQRIRDTQVFARTSYLQNVPHISPCPNNSISYSPQHAYTLANGSPDSSSVDQNVEETPKHTFNMPVANGHSSTLDGISFIDVSNGHSYFHGTEVGRSQMGISEEAMAAKEDHGTAIDLGESSIISNILSMDFDPWDESLTSPQNLAKFLGESDKQLESHRVLSARKAQSSNQSRFSFARQDECTDQGSNYAYAGSDFGRGLEYNNFNPRFVSNNSIYVDDKLSNGNGFSSFNYEESDNFASNHSPMVENKISVSRAQVSAPPGFSGPSRAPPPGFTSHERMEQTFDNLSGNHAFDTSLLRKAHHAPAPVNIGGVGDLEFMDPAILAVGGRVPSGLNSPSPSLDMRPNFPAQSNSFENDIRLQLLMQRSFSQQNPRFTEPGENYPQQTDSYGILSRMVEQALPNNLSPYQQTGFQQPRSSMMSNGHWNGWNEIQGGNDVAMAEILRNERLGFNRYYSGHEDTKFQLPTSGDLYNRTFGI